MTYRLGLPIGDDLYLCRIDVQVQVPMKMKIAVTTHRLSCTPYLMQPAKMKMMM